MLEPYDLLFARTGATTGKTHLVRQSPRSVFASYLIRLRPRPTELAEYLYFFFQSDNYWRQISDGKEGSAQPNVNGHKLMGIRVPVANPQVQSAIRAFLKAVRSRQDGLTISLPELPPPLSDQRRIVARIEGLSCKIREITKLRTDVEADRSRLLLATYLRVIDGAEWFRMGEVAPLVRRSVEVEPLREYLELGIRSFGKGTFHKPSITGAMLGNKRIFRIEPGDLLFNIVFAWEGAVAVAQPQDAGRVGSHRFLTCVPTDARVLTSFLAFHFLTDRGLEDLGIASPGGAGRNRTLGIEALARIKVPVPTPEKQRWFASLLEKAQAVGRLQAEVNTELDALMPSILSKAFRGEL